jgi:hypothetical protein
MALSLGIDMVLTAPKIFKKKNSESRGHGEVKHEVATESESSLQWRS